jgi:hypothetical protein
MKAGGKVKLKEILSYPYFTRVGGPLPVTVTKVNTWKMAAAECCSIKWENCRLMARNALQRSVETVAWARGEEWNAVITEVRPVIKTFVTEELAKHPVPVSDLPKLNAALVWDMMFLCLEYEFEDVLEPLFFIPFLQPWYAAGHFPCGWDGEEFPEQLEWEITPGKLIVF